MNIAKIILWLAFLALLGLYGHLGDQAHRDYAGLHVVSEHGSYPVMPWAERVDR